MSSFSLILPQLSLTNSQSCLSTMTFSFMFFLSPSLSRSRSHSRPLHVSRSRFCSGPQPRPCTTLSHARAITLSHAYTLSSKHALSPALANISTSIFAHALTIHPSQSFTPNSNLLPWLLLTLYLTFILSLTSHIVLVLTVTLAHNPNFVPVHDPTPSPTHVPMPFHTTSLNPTFTHASIPAPTLVPTTHFLTLLLRLLPTSLPHFCSRSYPWSRSRTYTLCYPHCYHGSRSRLYSSPHSYSCPFSFWLCLFWFLFLYSFTIAVPAALWSKYEKLTGCKYFSNTLRN